MTPPGPVGLTLTSRQQIPALEGAPSDAISRLKPPRSRAPEPLKMPSRLTEETLSSPVLVRLP